MFKNIFAALFMLFICIACGPKDEGSSVILPTGLSTSFIIDEGLVEVQATAQGANFYSFMFYDGGDSTYFESNDGAANYTFATTGTYSLKTRAHVTPYDYIEK